MRYINLYDRYQFEMAKKLGNSIVSSVQFGDLIYAKNFLSQICEIEAIRKGYPARILKEVSATLNISEGKLYKIVGISPTTASRLIKQDRNISPAASERIFRISMILRRGITAFSGDEEAVKDWLRLPNILLDDLIPLDMLDTELGGLAVMQALDRYLVTSCNESLET